MLGLNAAAKQLRPTQVAADGASDAALPRRYSGIELNSQCKREIMNQPEHESIHQEIVILVRCLFRAENYPGDRDAAANVLAADYLPITRAKGQVDHDREETLKRIAEAPITRHRDVDEATIEVALFQDDCVAIAKSLLPMTNSEADPPIVEHYRNMHVFLNRNKQ